MSIWENMGNFARRAYRPVRNTVLIGGLGWGLTNCASTNVTDVYSMAGSDAKVVTVDEKVEAKKVEEVKDTVSFEDISMPIKEYAKGDTETERKILSKVFKNLYGTVEPGWMNVTSVGKDSLNLDVSRLEYGETRIHKDDLPKPPIDTNNVSKRDLRRMERKDKSVSNLEKPWTVGISGEYSFDKFNADIFVNANVSWKNWVLNLKYDVAHLQNKSLGSNFYQNHEDNERGDPLAQRITRTYMDNDVDVTYHLGGAAQLGRTFKLTPKLDLTALIGVQYATLKKSNSMEETRKDVLSSVDYSYIEPENATLSSFVKNNYYEGIALPVDLNLDLNLKKGWSPFIGVGVSIPVSSDLKDLKYAPGVDPISAPVTYTLEAGVKKGF